MDTEELKRAMSFGSEKAVETVVETTETTVVETIVETPVVVEAPVVETPAAEVVETIVEEKQEKTFLEKLKEATPTTETVVETPIVETPTPVVETPKELTEEEKLQKKFIESGLTIAQLTKSIQITDYSKMSTEDLIRINLEKQLGAENVTEDLLEKESIGFENLLPSQQTAFLNNIKTTLGEEVKYSDEVARVLDEAIAAKGGKQVQVSQAEIEAQRQAQMDSEIKADLAEINAVITKLGVGEELAKTLVAEYSYEKAIAYVKDGKLDADTFLEHTFKIKDYENADKRGYERGVKETKEKYTNPKATSAAATSTNAKTMQEQIKDQLKYN